MTLNRLNIINRPTLGGIGANGGGGGSTPPTIFLVTDNEITTDNPNISVDQDTYTDGEKI